VRNSDSGNLNLAIVAKHMTATVKHSAGFAADKLEIEASQQIGEGEQLSNVLAQLEAMPDSHQRWLSIASRMASGAPEGERDDWRQEIYLKLVERNAIDIPLAWKVAQDYRNDLWVSWTRYHGFAEPFSNGGGLNADDPYVERTIGEIASEIPYLDDSLDAIESGIDCKALWESLNAGKRIKGILNKRLRGEALPAVDRKYLSRWLAVVKERIMSVSH